MVPKRRKKVFGLETRPWVAGDEEEDADEQLRSARGAQSPGLGTTARWYTLQGALTAEGTLIAVGVFTRDVKKPLPAKKIREQRLAALGNGSRRGNEDSLRSSAGRGRGGGAR